MGADLLELFDRQSDIISQQCELINELIRLLLQHVEAEDIEEVVGKHKSNGKFENIGSDGKGQRAFFVVPKL